MIQSWLEDVQEALHDSPDFQRLAIKGKIREIKKSYNGHRSLEVGRFSFTTTPGPRTTIVKYNNKEYGAIVDNEVFKCQGPENKLVSIGKLKGGNEDAQYNKPPERVRNSKGSSCSRIKPKFRPQKNSKRGKKGNSVKRHPPGGSRILRYLWSRH